MAGLLNLPDEILLQVASYLPPVDFVRFSLTSRRLYHLFDSDSLEWKKRFVRDLGKPCPTIQKVGRELLDSGTAITANPWKLNYLMQQRTFRNWSDNNYERYLLKFLERAESSKFVGKTGTFAYLLPTDDDDRFQMEISEKTDGRLEWKRKVVDVTEDLESDEVPTDIEGMDRKGDKYVFKLTCPSDFKRLLVCYDEKLDKIVWCKVAHYSPLYLATDCDSIMMNEKSYIILCLRTNHAEILIYNLEDGDLVTQLQLEDTRIGMFYQICPHQNFLAFTLMSDEKPMGFTLDLDFKDDFMALQCGDDMSVSSYPVAVLNSVVVMCENKELIVWSLQTNKCEYTIPLRDTYHLIKYYEILTYEAVDIVAYGWTEGQPGERILHILKIKDDKATVTCAFNLGFVGICSTIIRHLGESPILASTTKTQDETLLLVSTCGIRTTEPYKDWTRFTEVASVGFLTSTCLGLNIGDDFIVHDFLQIDNYTLNKN